MLLIPDDLHSLVPQLAAREQIIVVHDPLTEAVDLVEDRARQIILEADLPGGDGTDRRVDIHGLHDAVEGLEVPPADRRLHRRRQVPHGGAGRPLSPAGGGSTAAARGAASLALGCRSAR